MRRILFHKDGHDFTVYEYREVGPELKGMSENKIFCDRGKYFMNKRGILYEATNFKISKDGEETDKNTYNFDTKLRLGALIMCERKILVIHRRKPNQEYYVYPGGHLKQNESVEEGLKREIKEETGININKNKIYFINEIEQEDFGPEKSFFVELDLFPKKVFDSNPEETHGLSKLLWLSIEDAKKLKNLYPRGLIDLVLTKYY